MNAAEAVRNLYGDLQQAQEQNSEIKMHEAIAERLEGELLTFSIQIQKGNITNEVA